VFEFFQAHLGGGLSSQSHAVKRLRVHHWRIRKNRGHIYPEVDQKADTLCFRHYSWQLRNALTLPTPIRPLCVKRTLLERLCPYSSRQTYFHLLYLLLINFLPPMDSFNVLQLLARAANSTEVEEEESQYGYIPNEKICLMFLALFGVSTSPFYYSVSILPGSLPVPPSSASRSGHLL
jgi:hypothetical protein